MALKLENVPQLLVKQQLCDYQALLTNGAGKSSEKWKNSGKIEKI